MSSNISFGTYKTNTHMRKIISLATLLILLPCISFATTDKLGFELDNIINKELPGANVGVILIDAEQNDVIFERNANANFYPASGTKIFTSIAALQSLGKQYQFETSMHYHSKKLNEQTLNGNVSITFRGDPSFSTQDLTAMFKELSQKGIKKINGNIIIDDSLISDPDFAPGWTLDSAPWYYAAPISSIIINENKINLELTAQNQQAKLRKMGGNSQDIKVKSDVSLVSKSVTKRDCQLNIQQTDDEVILNGCWPRDRTPATLSLAVHNPRVVLEKQIRQALNKYNITLQKKVVFSAETDKGPAMIIRRSPPLKRILPFILSDSNNVYTEAVTKAIGLAYYGRAAFQTGALAIPAILQDTWQLDFTNFNLADGSGQSRYNFVSPYITAHVLNLMTNHPSFQIFKNSLSQPGKNGQLSFRFKDGTLKDNLFAKTGSASGTSSISGYMFNQNNKMFVFSIMINQSHLDYYPLKSAEDKIVKAMYHSL